MRAGRLRMRVRIEKPAQVRTPSGGVTIDWQLFADKVPADVAPVTGTQFFQGMQEQHGIDTKITLRYLAGLDSTMRILHDGVIYDIEAVLPDRTLRRSMTAMCKSGVNKG